MSNLLSLQAENYEFELYLSRTQAKVPYNQDYTFSNQKEDVTYSEDQPMLETTEETHSEPDAPQPVQEDPVECYILMLSEQI